MRKSYQIVNERIRLESIFVEVRKDLERIVRRRVRSVDVVGDLVQDIYMKCRRVEIDFPTKVDAAAYLRRMASNYAIDHERVELRREAILGDVASVNDMFDKQANSPEAYMMAADKAEQIEGVLSKLPKRTREMFVLVRLYGLSHQEAADRLGVSKSLVDKYVLQALLQCRTALGGLDQLD